MEWSNARTIDASVETVWQLTSDIAHLPEVTPTVRTAEVLDAGPLRVGTRARLAQPGQRPAVWTVTDLVPGREFCWQTSRRGLTMIGRHRVEPAGHGAVSTLALALRGPLAPLLRPVVRRRVERTLARENEGLAAAAARVTR